MALGQFSSASPLSLFLVQPAKFLSTIIFPARSPALAAQSACCQPLPPLPSRAPLTQPGLSHVLTRQCSGRADLTRALPATTVSFPAPRRDFPTYGPVPKH
jgi:hypothetical protein